MTPIGSPKPGFKRWLTHYFSGYFSSAYATLALLGIVLSFLLPIGFLFEQSNDNVRLFLWLNHLTSDHLSRLLWAWLTSFGDTSVAILEIWLMLPKNPISTFKLVLVFIMGSILSPLIKHRFDYPRPLAILGDQVHVIGPALHTHAYVSGHTMSAFLVAALLFFHYRSVWRYLAPVVAILVGVSRIMVGAHWPADVLMGGLTGWLAGWWSHQTSVQVAQYMQKTAWLQHAVQFLGGALLLGTLFFLLAQKMQNVAPVLLFWQLLASVVLVYLGAQIVTYGMTVWKNTNKRKNENVTPS